ncbi:hypothetical protein BGZ99_000543 [Dissophora globulifera]|uniref:Major facilitator superfamily (MFS) profile domain-containing protein n=1 Tax=Dissophora globulifera TaxID=979702 RepID=A0A9P6R3B7_9FUNG|nr:hypothetical protein BGZ99_000543 [Dissophora globulifera]
MSSLNVSATTSKVLSLDFDNLTPSDPVLPWYRRLGKIKGLLLVVICMATMLDTISVASVTIALPSILRDVHYEPNQLQWVVSSYALAYAAFLLVGGRIGSGAGFTIPSALALLTTTYPPGPERTFALSMFGSAACVGQTIGVLLGGIFDATIGWYWIFFITAIISGCLCATGFLIISKENDNPASADRRVDYFGIFLFMMGIIAIVYYLSESTTSGWASAKTLAPFLVGISMLIGFVFWENYIEYPIMPFRIWKSRRFLSSVIVIIGAMATYSILIFFSSLTFQNVLKFSPLITACCYIVHGAGLVIGLFTVTRMFDFVRTKIILMIGWILIAASAVIIAQIAPGQTYWHFAFPALIVNCLGLSPTWMCCQVNVIADANDEDQGVVGAVFNVAMQVGGPIGLAIATIVSQSHEGPGGSPVDLMDGYRAAFYTMAAFAGVAFMAAAIFASNYDPIEFTGKMSEALAEDQEKGISTVDSSSVRTVSEVEKVEVTEDKKQTLSA